MSHFVHRLGVLVNITTISSYINLVNDAIRSLAKLAKLGVVLHAFQGGAPPDSL